jgi:hypothetical protein
MYVCDDGLGVWLWFGYGLVGWSPGDEFLVPFVLGGVWFFGFLGD